MASRPQKATSTVPPPIEDSAADGRVRTRYVLDPREHAYRRDVADAALKGRVDAERFVRPSPHRLTGWRSAMMLAAPRPDAVAVSELLPGERFDTVDLADGWAWGYSHHDHYVGYVRAEHLAPGLPEPSHRITAPTALRFSAPDIKSAVGGTLPMMAGIAAEPFDDRFLRLADGSFVHRRHAGGPTPPWTDPVAVARDFLGTPYRWGGRQRTGIDCSGLIQIVLGACGIAAPRDSDQQRDRLGRDVRDQEREAGDIVFFPGHVGIMVDDANLLHANATFMTTLIEPLANVVERMAAEHPDPISAIKRL